MDEVKLADATGEMGPIDPFKTEYHVKSSKFNIANKVNHENHWRNNDKISDPKVIKGWRPLLKWSEGESNFVCCGADRPFRTFAKIVDHAMTDDINEADRNQKMEELIIKQAPKSL